MIIDDEAPAGPDWAPLNEGSIAQFNQNRRDEALAEVARWLEAEGIAQGARERVFAKVRALLDHREQIELAELVTAGLLPGPSRVLQ